jgi:hypothetical protein
MCPPRSGPRVFPSRRENEGVRASRGRRCLELERSTGGRRPGILAVVEELGAQLRWRFVTGGSIAASYVYVIPSTMVHRVVASKYQWEMSAERERRRAPRGSLLRPFPLLLHPHGRTHGQAVHIRSHDLRLHRRNRRRLRRSPRLASPPALLLARGFGVLCGVPRALAPPPLRVRLRLHRSRTARRGARGRACRWGDAGVRCDERPAPRDARPRASPPRGAKCHFSQNKSGAPESSSLLSPPTLVATTLCLGALIADVNIRAMQLCDNTVPRRTRAGTPTASAQQRPPRT